MSSTFSPFLPAFTECCELKLMDANRQVAIETERELPTGTFEAVRLRLCTTDPVSIQIWTRVSATQFTFKWQTQFTATLDQINQAYSIINLHNIPITIGPGDRLGFYNPSNASLKIPVPYDTNPLTAAQYFSLDRFTGSQFVSGVAITLDDLKWPRTFENFITFCPTETDCPAGATVMPPVTTMARGPAVALSGPPSLPSPGYPGQCCGNPISACDPTGGIKDNIDSQADQIKVLEDDIKELLIILNNLINSNLVTGICPNGSISGVYGVGSCYIFHRDERVQMAQAVIKCRDLYSAGLLKIQTELEDRFIKNWIFNNTKPGEIEQYWTAGMYNIPLRNWYWYDDNTRTKAPYTYRNWKNGMEPSATGIYDVCSVYTIDTLPSLDYWEKNECTLANYFICEIPKKCL
jgi:hypothetical protein